MAPPDPGEGQAAARRGAAVRQARRWRRGARQRQGRQARLRADPGPAQGEPSASRKKAGRRSKKPRSRPTRARAKPKTEPSPADLRDRRQGRSVWNRAPPLPHCRADACRLRLDPPRTARASTSSLPTAGSIPSRPVDRALVTHGHADHARGGHGADDRHARDAGDHGAALRRRDEGATPVAYGETIAPAAAASTRPSSPPAMCSARAQILLEHAGERVVVTGDYKRRPDPDLPAVRSRRPATSSSPRRPSACRCSAIRRSSEEIAKLLDGAAPPIPIAACWSAPMRWARRSG